MGGLASARQREGTASCKSTRIRAVEGRGSSVQSVRIRAAKGRDISVQSARIHAAKGRNSSVQSARIRAAYPGYLHAWTILAILAWGLSWLSQRARTILAISKRSSKRSSKRNDLARGPTYSVPTTIHRERLSAGKGAISRGVGPHHHHITYHVMWRKEPSLPLPMPRCAWCCSCTPQLSLRQLPPAQRTANTANTYCPPPLPLPLPLSLLLCRLPCN